MSRSRSTIFVVGLFAAFITMTFFAMRTSKNDALSNNVRVTASFYPLAYIASQVGGLRVSVKDILPSGGEPHDFEPSPRDFAELGRSNLFIYNGAHFEPWVEKWQGGSSARPAYVIAMIDELGKSGAILIKRGGETDPHVWLDPALFKQEVLIVRDALIAADSIHADEYRANAEKLIYALDELDQKFREGLRSCANKSIVTSHDAFGYLARRYGFGVIPIAGISPDEEPSPKAIASIIEAVRAENIKYIFFEATVSPKLSEVIAREVGGNTLVLNPLESLTINEVQLKEDYLSVMEKNLNNLRIALSCN